MEISFLYKGLLIGFSIAAPVGVIGLLCINRSLVDGRKSGFISGLGAATADGIYGAIAGCSLTFLSSFLISHQVGLRLIGGLFLCYLGIKTLLTKPVYKNIAVKKTNLINAYLSTFFLTLTNPMTIIAFTATFAGLGLADVKTNYDSALSLVLGVFLGSAFWWLILTSFVDLFRHKINYKSMYFINVISGLIIITFGLIALL